MCVHEKDVVFSKFNYLMQLKSINHITIELNHMQFTHTHPHIYIHTHINMSVKLTAKTRMQKLVRLQQIKQTKGFTKH